MTGKKAEEKKGKDEGKDIKGIVAEKDEFSEWYTQLILKADLADYSKVSGCIVFKPTAYAIWEKIKDEVDKRFKKLGIKNAYFPLLIPESLLKKEQEHVEGFTPEVAWVTEAGDTKLAERLAVRPTSEAIMYDSYSKWIRSWRDLPLKLNQWNNVVRWEFKHPVPFLRTREFLWNELHTVLSTEKEALAEGPEILEAYRDVCENYLALYGVTGRKTEKETFAGGVFSVKFHYVMPNGKSIEGPCFHHDGQNFAKAYDIKFLDKDGKVSYAWQNTYAITTRMLGVIFAVHSDSKGLVMPPRIAPNKVVIVPIYTEENREKVLSAARHIEKSLSKFDVIVDDRDEYRPGFKFNEWELKGIPLRIELGAKELEKEEAMLYRRDNGKKSSVKFNDLVGQVEMALEAMHNSMFEKSKKMFEDSIVKADTLEKAKKAISEKKIALVPLCKNMGCEDMVKYETGGAKTLFVASEKVKNEKCIICKKKADYFVYIGKSY